ncbi:uracil-DNA glycosylase family protein [Acidovorax soli]|uniref:uracil-DNA glycosylase family protein n=1 Tax=Acidovorax soli TaxID=592050 RepID=UPI0032B2E0F1
MSLHLDARQRAMLQEMGVTVWAPAETPAPAPPPVADAVRAQQTATAPAAHPPAMAAADAGSQPAPRTARERAIPPGVQPPVPQGGSAPALVLHAPQALYPAADPAQTPAGLGAGWLVVAESLSPTEPLAGEAGRLLDNMLRAMRLHLHPRVFLAILERPPASAAAGAADVSVALEEAVTTLRPAMVLVLGHVAARAALARTEPLGRLRAELHQLAGCPAIVTYDPAFLLRAQGNKAAAWADLCRALALVQATPASP